MGSETDEVASLLEDTYDSLDINEVSLETAVFFINLFCFSHFYCRLMMLNMIYRRLPLRRWKVCYGTWNQRKGATMLPYILFKV